MRKPLIIAFLFILAGCGLPEGYHKELEAVAVGIPEASAFLAKHPNNLQSISHYLEKGHSAYTAQTVLYGRYLIRIDVNSLQFSNDQKTLIKNDPITLDVNEMVSIEHQDDGRTLISYGENHSLDVVQLRKLIANGFNFSSVQINLKTNQPIEGINKYWKERKAKNRG